MAETQDRIRIEKEQLLTEWWQLQQTLKTTKDREMALRKELFKYYFPNPMTGTNKVNIGPGFALKAVYKTEAKMDFAQFEALCETEEFVEKGIYKQDVVEYKPFFNESLFKKLTKDKQELIERALVWKPAAPAMEIVPVKKDSDD